MTVNKQPQCLKKKNTQVCLGGSMKARPDGLEPGVGVCTTVPGEGHSGPSGLGPVGESVEPRWTLPTLGGRTKGARCLQARKAEPDPGWELRAIVLMDSKESRRRSLWRRGGSDRDANTKLAPNPDCKGASERTRAAPFHHGSAGLTPDNPFSWVLKDALPSFASLA